MASIFTYDSEPPRISSPWPAVPSAVANDVSKEGKPLLAGLKTPRAEVLASCGLEKLESEPQEGPTEYKLHLLLRPRRNYASTSTVQNVPGSFLSKSRAPWSHSDTDVKQMNHKPVLAASNQSRQSRLQHLTTQLLWRLQQSSPYHSSSVSSLILPTLPEYEIERSALKGPGPLIPGLEGSSGALYEIGVSDDGTFVGLAKDELEESLAVLRAMAFSLGCSIKVLRMIIVGDCEWNEEAQSGTNAKPVNRLRKEKLWVAEVLVAPNLDSLDDLPDMTALKLDYGSPAGVKDPRNDSATDGIEPQGDQLRVSLTGSTTSGKSSLLGTLSTSTLDNGRGKSRLSLLKHRHEIVTGVTSSLAQELFGYDNVASCLSVPCTKIINYATGNVSSWDEIHNSSSRDRLVFVTDSAGHPRYRRTTVRGLLSWAPHWTLCCVAADDQDDSSGRIGATASSSEVLGSAGLGVDLSKAHLDLCLKLNLALVVVITKLDLATKTGLRDTLAKVLTMLKSAGRKPIILSSSPNDRFDAQLQSTRKDDEEAVRRAVTSVQSDELPLLVPIVLTSAVTGNGIGKLHTLLHRLPIANNGLNCEFNTQPPDETSRTLFHIDEVFAMPSTSRAVKSKAGTPSTILSGYLRRGTLEVGDRMLVGPHASDSVDHVDDSRNLQRARSFPGLVQVSPRKVLASDLPRPSLDNRGTRGAAHGKPYRDIQGWQEVRITSLRNLRLPVRKLHADQVGTVGITLHAVKTSSTIHSPEPELCIRRGMVMLPILEDSGDRLPSYSRFSAVFKEAGLPAWPGVLVIVYIASIRATARIIQVRALEKTTTVDEVFNFDDSASEASGISTAQPLAGDQQTEITFEFATTNEWVEIGTQVLVTPGGGPSLTGQPEQREIGSAGLDGYVGKIVHAIVG